MWLLRSSDNNSYDAGGMMMTVTMKMMINDDGSYFRVMRMMLFILRIIVWHL